MVHQIDNYVSVVIPEFLTITARLQSTLNDLTEVKVTVLTSYCQGYTKQIITSYSSYFSHYYLVYIFLLTEHNFAYSI